ncbi:MAG: virulence factor [Lentisphaeria bacterium]|jgi:hypothetical protein|nr:virulence factor [Lentisphaeria bacterium]
MATYQILYWRDIPAQVRVFDGSERLTKVLPDRFQEEIDHVATSEGITESDAYLDLWDWTEKRDRDGVPAELLETLVAELIAAHDAKA